MTRNYNIRVKEDVYKEIKKISLVEDSNMLSIADKVLREGIKSLYDMNKINDELKKTLGLD